MAFGASSCCVLPFALFSLGVGGAWVGNLTAMMIYRPFFIGFGLCFLAAGYWQVFKRPVLSSGEVCITPFSQRINQTVVILASLLMLIAIAWPYVFPLVIN
jgi:mercuric ion transport protein